MITGTISAGWGIYHSVCTLSYWIILIVQYHAYLILLPSALEQRINPPEPRWPDATVHRIIQGLHCIVIIDCSVLFSISVLSIFTNVKTLFIPSHNSFTGRSSCTFFLRQRRAFENHMTWIRSVPKHPRFWPTPWKFNWNSRVDLQAEKRPRRPPAGITASPRAPSWQCLGGRKKKKLQF